MTPLIRLIYLWSKVLEWIGKIFVALGLRCGNRASILRSKVIEKLQIRKEKMQRGDKDTNYQLFVSYDAGMTYRIEFTSTNLKKVIAFGKDLDDLMLRWYIMDNAGMLVGIACKIYGSILDSLLKIPKAYRTAGRPK